MERRTRKRNGLNIRIRAAKGLETRIIERPGRWMTPADLADLLADLRTVARAALPTGELSYGVLTGDPDRLANAVVTIVYDRASGRPIAFNALAVMEASLRGQPVEIVHLGLVMIDPDYRNRGVSWILYGLTCVLLFLRNQCRPFWLSNVTQVPAIVGMVAETFSQVFPAPDLSARRSFDHLLLARQIMQNHRHVFGVGSDALFDEARFVIADAYTGGSDHLKKTFEQAPKHRRPTFNEMCQRELDYERGDDFLQLGRIDIDAVRRYLARMAPPSSLPGLIGTGSLLALQSTILPVVHWFSDDRPWGTLRPWKT